MQWRNSTTNQCVHTLKRRNYNTWAKRFRPGLYWSN